MLKFLMKVIFSAVILASLSVGASADQKFNDGWDDHKQKSSVTSLLEKEFGPSKQRDSNFDISSMVKTFNSCGFAPIPPLGCKNPTCICDQNGQNCRWIFQCN